MTWTQLLLLLLVVSVTSSLADITGTSPPVGACLCPSISNLNVWDSACGNVTGVIGYNQCYQFTGNSQTCTTDLEYEFFEIDISGQTRWAVGHGLNSEPASYCTAPICGAPMPQSAERIIDGTDAVRNMYPWQLALERDSAGVYQLICGAALIDANWAVTAAHCLDDQSGSIRLVAGVYNFSEPIDAGTQVRNVQSSHVTVYPDYNSTSLENDIAIIHLPSGYEVSGQTIRTICLPPSNDSSFYESPSCYITGWGITQAGSTITSQVLQRSGIDVIRPLNCEVLLQRPILTSELCTDDQANHDVTPCTGDWGGPLSCLVNSRFQLAGIGSYTNAECNPLFPQIFVNITQFLDWIKQVTGLP